MLELIPNIIQSVATIFLTDPFIYFTALAVLSGTVGIILKFRR